jgi:hypothetical protein
MEQDFHFHYQADRADRKLRLAQLQCYRGFWGKATVTAVAEQKPPSSFTQR